MVRFHALADVFDVLVGNVETVSPLLKRYFTVAINVALVEEVSDAVFERFEGGNEWKELGSAHDSIFRRVHLTEFPQNWHDFWVF